MARAAAQGNGAQRARRSAPPTDATGREKDRLQAIHQPAIEEAATQVTTTAGPPVVESDDVIDYSEGGGPSAEAAEDGVRLLTMEEAIGDGRTEHTIDDLPVDQVDLNDLPDGRTDVRPEQVRQLDQPQPAHVPQADPRIVTAAIPVDVPPEVEEVFRIMRVNTDLPDVTIGKDNHFTFREGKRYKVPQYVYDHLDEKGYVFH